jgi:hypothetical protein
MLPHALLVTVLVGVHGGPFFDTKTTLPAAGVEIPIVSGSVAWTPALDYVRYKNKDSDVLIGHLNIAYRRSFSSGKFVWIGAGESLAYLNGSGNGSTGYPNVDLGFGIRRGRSEIYLSARSVDFFIPIFRDSWAGHGAMVAIGARRVLNRAAKP